MYMFGVHRPQWPPRKKPALFCGFDDFASDETTAGMVKSDSLSVFISMFVGEFLLSNILRLRNEDTFLKMISFH